MANKKVIITDAQILAIIDLVDISSSMIGCGEDGSDNYVKKNIKLIDRFLKKNGYKR